MLNHFLLGLYVHIIRQHCPFVSVPYGLLARKMRRTRKTKLGVSVSWVVVRQKRRKNDV